MAETWTPTPAEVHALIPTRNDGDVFDAASTPSADEVSALAETITGEILAEVGELPDIDADDIRTQRIHDTAEAAAAFGTAALVEWGGFPEQNNFDTGAGNAGAGLFSRYRHNVELLKAQLGRYHRRGRPGGSTIRLGSAFSQPEPMRW